MNKTIFKITLILAMTGSLYFTSCNSPQEKLDDKKTAVKDAKENLDEARENYKQEYDQFKMESNKKISANEKLIADLKDYSKGVSQSAKSEYHTAISTLEKKNKALKNKMENYADKGSEKWESFKREFNHDLNALSEALKDLGKKNTK